MKHVESTLGLLKSSSFFTSLRSGSDNSDMIYLLVSWKFIMSKYEGCQYGHAWPTIPYAKSTLGHAPCQLIPILISIESISLPTPHISHNHHKHVHFLSFTPFSNTTLPSSMLPMNMNTNPFLSSSITNSLLMHIAPLLPISTLVFQPISLSLSLKLLSCPFF